MKMILFLLLLSMLYSCSSTQTSDNELEDDFDTISNQDFKMIDEAPYREYEDMYTQDLAKDDSLIRESIARLPDPKLEAIGNKIDNPISKGISYCYRKRYKEAFAIFDKTYFKYKNHPSYWNQVGTCYFLKGEMKKAFLYYNKARDINPNYVPAINNHGVIYQHRGENGKALDAYAKASKVNSFFLTPLFNMGQLYLRYGFAKKAKQIFKTMLNKNPHDIDAVNGLATTYFLLGNISSALAYWKKLGGNHYEKPYIGINYAVALKMKGFDEAAEAIIEDIDTKQLGQLSYYYRKAKLYIGAR